MLKKTLIRSGIGFLIGIAAGNLIAAMTGMDDSSVIIPVSDQLVAAAGESIPMAYVLQCLFSGLYGALCFGCIGFYDIERWPLALATGAHCAVIVLTYIPLGFFLGWLCNITQMLIVAGIQIVVFFIIWLILYLTYKKQVKDLNKMQSSIQHKSRSKQEED